MTIPESGDKKVQLVRANGTELALLVERHGVSKVDVVNDLIEKTCWYMNAAIEAFEKKYHRDSRDPTCADKLAIWLAAWNASVDAACERARLEKHGQSADAREGIDAAICAILRIKNLSENIGATKIAELADDDASLAARYADSSYGDANSAPDRAGMMRLAELGLVYEVIPGQFCETPYLRAHGY